MLINIHYFGLIVLGMTYKEALDISDFHFQSIYRRHSNEEMPVQMHCWAINVGCCLPDNEFLYFIAPDKSAQCWMTGLTIVCLSFTRTVIP